jgi:hypothetical protein
VSPPADPGRQSATVILFAQGHWLMASPPDGEKALSDESDRALSLPEGSSLGVDDGI